VSWEGALAPNPFTYGNPISNPVRFFGRQREVDQVFSRLGNLEFESSSLVGERRMGKTSLLNYLADPSVRQRYGFDRPGDVFLYFDLQAIDRSTTPARLWQQLLRRLGRDCQDEAVRAELAALREPDDIDNFALIDLFDKLEDRQLRVVLLLDEFENITENERFDEYFFNGLRSLAIHHNLALVTSSRRELIDLCHSDAIRSSPFFNIFANIPLPLFSEQEARQLVDSSLAGTAVRFDEAEVASLIGLAGCHPLFLQIAGRFLFEAHERGLPPHERLGMLERELCREVAPHLRELWENSPDQERILLTALALLESQGKAGQHGFRLDQLRTLYGRSDQMLTHLDRRGLLVLRDGEYALASPVFGAWIVDEIRNSLEPGQEYAAWLEGNRNLMERLPSQIQGQLTNEMGAVLPQVSAKYREMVIGWASDPRNLIAVAGLLRGVLG
jgi:hypothetical protein